MPDRINVDNWREGESLASSFKMLTIMTVHMLQLIGFFSVHIPFRILYICYLFTYLFYVLKYRKQTYAIKYVLKK